MPQSTIPTTLSIYIPKSKEDQNVMERLQKLGKKQDRSINYLIVAALVEYLKREERKSRV